MNQSYEIYKRWNKGKNILTLESFQKEYKRLNSIYTILVDYGKAEESKRDYFIFDHFSSNEYPCYEWRFCGQFGFGGKYRSQTNTVDYYSEDRTDKLDKLEKLINMKLKEIDNGNI